eukprot:CAMPEP_0183359396 /NCGR_PEP_ID=MMETSP0164_2-20130417/52078_1 /TAXON_ID=221442 /ORGANISM="Coccolithus pelagicus ssp braarudi, Strain PLY182g" /LENGTH=49 /DNA_ID= /DNA_START= /DNA_END= /DNA_ORIENTATION=
MIAVATPSSGAANSVSVRGASSATDCDACAAGPISAWATMESSQPLAMS